MSREKPTPPQAAAAAGSPEQGTNVHTQVTTSANAIAKLLVLGTEYNLSAFDEFWHLYQSSAEVITELHQVKKLVEQATQAWSTPEQKTERANLLCLIDLVAAIFEPAL